ncbi:unnamed protein product [Brassicogethes aeneus]|uniref:Uncharacterized protein n=1 Tax=Brassicogethes aeneus TaxID=1431903 RepID=A0A9P0FBT2_BRAAE|nr:unnamed protein product [Brassicogethes aeneus]
MDDTAMFEPDMLGKDDTLPQTVTLPQFTAARGKEVQIMKKTLGSSMIYTNKLAFQKLPRYMRRRAMSHNVKRLPRRLREIHKNQITKSGLPQKTKRPSRKYVRRPYNLNSDYMRRRRRVYWLDTHIWHAKRFFMTEKWGCKIPFKPCDRSFKACYRATRNHCLLQDISYYKCIELKGDYSGIVEKFKRLINSKNGLTIGAKTYESGKREGTIYLYKFGSNNECIGKVNFLWKPIEVKHKRTLWLWLHPALYSKALETIVLCFDLKTCLDIDAENLTEMYFNDEFELTDITSELSRFRLTGPLATAVLQKCFVPFEETIDECIDWIGDYKEKHEFDFSNNLEVWNDLSHVSTFSQIPPHIVLSLIIRDPRFNLPKTRTKALPGYENFPEFHYDNSKDINKSPLWSNTVRAAVKHAKITNHKVIELRQDILVPGTDLESKGLPIPILLIQRPGCKNIDTPGYGSGWDVILPGGWAQPTWISLIMFGARSGGLQETNTITFEMGQNDSLEPDTEAGAREEADVSEKCRESFVLQLEAFVK